MSNNQIGSREMSVWQMTVDSCNWNLSGFVMQHVFANIALMTFRVNQFWVLINRFFRFVLGIGINRFDLPEIVIDILMKRTKISLIIKMVSQIEQMTNSIWNKDNLNLNKNTSRIWVIISIIWKIIVIISQFGQSPPCIRQNQRSSEVESLVYHQTEPLYAHICFPNRINRNQLTRIHSHVRMQPKTIITHTHHMLRFFLFVSPMVHLCITVSSSCYTDRTYLAMATHVYRFWRKLLVFGQGTCRTQCRAIVVWNQ